MPSDRIEVTPVRSRSDRRAFRLLPFRLYASDPDWVPPLHRDIKGFLDPARHPFSLSGDIEFFLARRGIAAVGRIAAILNRVHNDYHGERTGFFGFFETENDSAVASALLDTAAEWVAARGMVALRGPCSPSTNYECGLLVDGDPGPPTLMMPHNPRWYAGQVEGCGFTKAMDLYAYRQDQETSDIDRWARIAERIRQRAGVTIRPLDKRRLDADVRAIVEIYHDAWGRNWGFVPINDAEVRRMVSELRPVIVPWLGGFVERDGRALGFHLGLPDYNRVLIRLKGRLFPFGFLKLLRARTRLPFMRLLLMGVRQDSQHLGLDVLLYDDIVRNSLAHGITSNESSWILETNLPMIHTLERAGARRSRTYRIFEKSLRSGA